MGMKAHPERKLKAEVKSVELDQARNRYAEEAQD
jgi:hypothetical protein